MEKPKVLIISTGGTISSTIEKDGSYSPVIGAGGFLDSIPEVMEIAECEAQPFCNVLSFALTPEKVFEMVSVIKERLKHESFAGAVVTQGTGTMEEAAYLADLLWDLEKPLIFTGAMLNASERDWDGARNILNSVITAITPEARGKGVLVCMGGEIHTARDVMKLHKTSLTTFCSPNGGAIGIVSDSGAVFYRNPLRRRVFHPGFIETRVDIIKISMGIDARLLRASMDTGAKGIVLETFPGGGGVTPEIAETVKGARKDGLVIVSAPRAPMGTLKVIAGSGCGPWDLKSWGVIMAGDLTSVKARILLMVTLPVIKAHRELEEIFRQIAP